MRGIERLPEMTAVEGRVSGGIRWKPTLDADWQDVNLLALEDFEDQQLDLFGLRTSRWSGTDTVAAEWTQRTAFDVPGLGETPCLEVGDRPRPFELSGTLRDPSEAPPPFSTQPSFYVTRDTTVDIKPGEAHPDLRWGLTSVVTFAELPLPRPILPNSSPESSIEIALALKQPCKP